jgi:hypothetical protein
MALRTLVRSMAARAPAAHASRMMMPLRPSCASLTSAPMRSLATAASSSSSVEEAADDADALDARVQFTTQPLDRDGNPIGSPELLRSADGGPLDPRHFRLPNESFIMVRIHPLHKYNKKIITGGPESRKNTRGAKVPVPAIPREKDPYLVAFRVPLHYNKLQIRNYLEEIYKIDVVDVHTMIYLGQHTPCILFPSLRALRLVHYSCFLLDVHRVRMRYCFHDVLFDACLLRLRLLMFVMLLVFYSCCLCVFASVSHREGSAQPYDGIVGEEE